MADNNPLNEWQAMSEYWALQNSTVLKGQSVAHGDGKLVLLIPGLFGNDLYLHTMRDWLIRIDYKPVMSKLGLNVGCPKRLLTEIESSVQQEIVAHEGDIAVIGHSRGGVLAKAMAMRLGPRVRNVILIGSPLGGMLRYGKQGLDQFANSLGEDETLARSSVMKMGRRVTQMLDPDCDSPMCGCEYIDQVLAPLPASTLVTSIYSSTDPIVPPQASNVAGAHNIEVKGTHAGLMFNKEVYPHVAAALAI